MSHPNSKHEAEQLLGGYATGTLSEQEKATLFAAALEQQELFDALADEEVLRELLADPRARQRLLEALGQPRVIPFWRRPAVLGVAAGVMLLFTTTLLVRRQPEVLNKVSSKVADAAPMTKPAPSAPASPQPAAKPVASPKAAELVAQPSINGLKEAKQKAEDRSLGGVDAIGATAPPATRAPVQTAMAGNAIAAGGQGPAPAAAPAEEAAALGASVDARAESEAPMKVEKAKMARSASDESRRRLVGPVCTLSKLEGGKIQLTVTWESRGHLYVLSRRGTTVVLLSPSRVAPGTSGTTESVYECSGGGALDVYLLQVPASQPSALPAEGPVDGYRRRLNP